MVKSMRLHVSACIYIIHMYYDCLFYTCICMFTYDDMIMMLSLKVTHYEIYVFKSFKLNLCMSTAFIIKPEVAGMMTMTQCLSSRDPMMVIFIEPPDLHWHFDPVLNASVMVARVAMRVYMFHSREFRG